MRTTERISKRFEGVSGSIDGGVKKKIRKLNSANIRESYDDDVNAKAAYDRPCLHTVLFFILTFMAALNWVALLLVHPLEFKTLLQFWLYHEQKRDIAALKEHPTSGWDRPNMRRCWQFLDMTSRSFSAVIKELDGDLARTVSRRIVSRRGTVD